MSMLYDSHAQARYAAELPHAQAHNIAELP